MTESDSLHDDLARSLGSGYTVNRELGGGGMSRVFVATDGALGRTVVVKVLPRELAAELSIERFRREITLAARLQHPHIVPVLAAGETDGLPYFTMPYVAGESLRERLSARGEMPVSTGVRILREVASALGAAHQKGIVHRDIKPENILLSDGSAMVTDFGVAKALNDAASKDGTLAELTEVGMTLGTPAYMSPEQAAASTTVDARADIYAFGIMAYEMFAGRTPFAGRSPQATLAAHVIEAPEAVQKLRTSLPLPVASLIMQCIEKHPADRPQTAAEIVRALDASVEGTSNNKGSSRASGTIAANGSRAFSGGLSRTAMAAAGAIAIALVVVAIVALRIRSTGQIAEADRTLAVMPFVNSDTATQYLSLGIVDEVRNQLSTHAQGLRIISASSSNSYRNKEWDAQAVGEKLHVAYLVTGEITAGRNGIHVSSELVNTSDGTARTLALFDRKEGDVSSLPDSIARAITAAFKVKPQTASQAPAGNAGTTNDQAYKLYLRARYLTDKRGKEELLTAATLAQQAIALDPKFARAYAELGIALGLLPGYGAWNQDSAKIQALRNEDKAIALDSTLARAWAARGFFMQNSYDWNETERFLRRSVELDPKQGITHKWLCQVIAKRGKIDDALNECRTATELDPLLATTWDTYGAILYAARKDSLSLEAVQRALDINPRSLFAAETRAHILIDRKQPQQALALFKDPSFVAISDPGMVGYVYAAAGLRDSAMRIVATLSARAKTDSGALAPLAQTYLGLGDVNRAIDYYIRAIRARDYLVAIYSVIAPSLDPLRTSPRYAEFLQALNLQNEPAGRFATPGSVSTPPAQARKP